MSVADVPTVELVLTGFGPFLNVVHNPSSVIMRLVAKYFGEKPTATDDSSNTDAGAVGAPCSVRVVVTSVDELEVSVQAVDRYVRKKRASLDTAAAASASDAGNAAAHQSTIDTTDATATTATADPAAAPPSCREEARDANAIVLFVHFGVNRPAEGSIQVETEAVNCVTLPAGDHSGFATDVCAPIVRDPSNTSVAAAAAAAAVVAPASRAGAATPHDDADADASAPVASAAAAAGAAASFTKDSGVGKPGAATQPSSSTIAPYHRTLVTSLAAQVREVCTAIAGRVRRGNPTNNNNNKGDASDAAAPAPAAVTARPPIVPSTNAGTYLCNFVFFLSLLKLACGPRVIGRQPCDDPDELDEVSHTRPFLPDDTLDGCAGMSAASSGGGGGGGRGTGTGRGAVAAPSKRHSLFIHVLRENCCDVETQAAVVCDFLERLMIRVASVRPCSPA